MSQIEWCDKTWNPTVGCTRVSPGCDNCYAVAMTRRLEAMGQEKYAGLVNPGKGHFNGVARLAPEALALPLSWRKPARVFVNSMSDLFHEALPDYEIAAVFGVMAVTPHLTYQVLTKRPERAVEWFRWAASYGAGTPDALVQRRAYEHLGDRFPVHPVKGTLRSYPWPPLNVWLGVSVEDRERKARIDNLREIPAALRFLSLEPLLEDLGELDLTGIDWVIAGGESGPGARPPKAEWFRSVRDQCSAAGVPFLFKQWGRWCPYDQLPEETKRDLDASGAQLYTDPAPPQPLGVGKKWAGRELDEVVHDEFPAAAGAQC